MQERELYRVFTACMAAYLRGETCAPSLTDDEWKALYAIAKRQSLSGALFVSLKKTDLPTALFVKLQRDAYVTLTAFEGQEQARRDVKAALDAAGVTHVFFKGAVIRAYYRDPSMRSMGDIDAAIRERDRDAAHEALTATGFAAGARTAEVWNYTRDGVLLELHTVVRRYNVTAQYAEDYDMLWQDTEAADRCTVRLRDAAHFAYVIAHMASHFSGGGCGLRQLMDVAVCLTHRRDSALWEAVLERLCPLGLDGFARRLFWLCQEWFGCEAAEELCTACDEECERFFLTRLLGEGAFGADERVLLAQMRREARLQKGGGKAGSLWRRLFPPARELRRRYSYAKHAVLLPVACGHRWIDGVTKNRRIHRKRAAFAKEQEEQLVYEAAMFEKIGL